VADKDAPKFEVLLERFRAKVNGMPEECHEALFWFLRFRYIQKHRIALENTLRQVTNLSARVFWASGIPEPIRLALVGEEAYLLAENGKQQAKNDDRESKKKKRVKQVASVFSLEEMALRRCEKAFEQTAWYHQVAKAAAEGEGMGPAIAGPLLWTIGSASRFASFGKLVRYAGLDVQDGKAPKRRKGQRITWNPELRTTLYKLSENWNKIPNGVWRARWDAYKAWYAENRPEILNEVSEKGKPCGLGHIHNMARRKVQREFLRNLYALWLEYEREREMVAV
jgi:hypothetical protein